MNAAVLVLDVGMRPLRVESWERAICDFFLGKVEIVEYSKDRTIHSANRSWPMPSVVRILHHFKRERLQVKFSRINIYTRDGFRCQFCGLPGKTEELTFDHVLPRSRGGRTVWENIVTCCMPCNKHKGDHIPAEAGMRLLKVPRKPAYLPLITVKMDNRNLPSEWAPYWTTTLDS
jgi:5-methylcytosine-specific restriction endonuclease McrA